MVYTRRVLTVFAGAVFALPALAQGPAIYGGNYAAQSAAFSNTASPAFVAMSSGETEQKRTAELLAQGQRSSSMSSKAGAASRFDERLTVTRRSSLDSPVYASSAASAPVIIAPPSPDYATADAMQARAGYQVASASPVRYEAIPAPAPSYEVAAAAAPVSDAYANSYNLGGNSIPAMPNARPGECFALARIPEKFRSYEKQYELRAASERLETTPPRYENVTEQYVVAEAFERMEVVPASFKNLTETVEAAPPSSRYVTTEPVYENVTERVLEQPARTVWKRGSGPIQRIDNGTGEIMCLVEEPAIYKNITRRVLKTPADVREIPVPGQTTTITRRVIDRPAEVRRVLVPEQIGTRTVRRLVEPGQVRRIPIPAQTGTTTVRELVEPARLEWRPVLCETNMTPEVIGRVQQALAAAGFNPGPVNGRLSAETVNALNLYQRSRNLPEDRYLNIDTVRALGVM